MAINKLLLIVAVLFIIPSVFALENSSYAGNSLLGAETGSTVITTQEQLRQLQEVSALQSDSQIAVKQITVEEEKQKVLSYISTMWQMILGLFVIYFQIIKGVFYLIQMYIMFYFLFILVPNVLIKIKEVLLTWYQKIQTN